MSELVFLFSVNADIQTGYEFYEAIQSGRGEIFMRHLDVTWLSGSFSHRPMLGAHQSPQRIPQLRDRWDRWRFCALAGIGGACILIP